MSWHESGGATVTEDSHNKGEQSGAGRRAPDHVLHKKAEWGPLTIASGRDHVRAWVPGSGVATIVAPESRGLADQETLKLLKEGLAVLLEGEEIVTLRQPERRITHRKDRAIHVEGPREFVPAGTILRARGYYSMGMEVEGGRRLVRPRLDLLDAPFLWGLNARPPAVDPTVEPDLLAVWGAASWHLLATVLQ